MNKIYLIGRLVADPELSTTSSGINSCRFRIAVTRPHSKDESDFFTIQTWRGLADNCSKYLKKGSLCSVCGYLQNYSFEKNGEKRTTTQIIAEEVEFLSLSNKNTSSKVENRTQTAFQTELTPISDDNLPF